MSNDPAFPPVQNWYPDRHTYGTYLLTPELRAYLHQGGTLLVTVGRETVLVRWSEAIGDAEGREP